MDIDNLKLDQHEESRLSNMSESMNACARPAYVRHGEQKLVIFGKKRKICKKRPNLRMIKRSPFCSLDNAWFIVSNHGTSEMCQSTATSLKVWTICQYSISVYHFLLLQKIVLVQTKLVPAVIGVAKKKTDSEEQMLFGESINIFALFHVLSVRIRQQ